VSFPIFLVRHAEAQGGGVDADRRLSVSGRESFAALLQVLGPKLTVKRVLTSPFRRARETAALLAGATGAPAEPSDDLASGHAGGLELLALARQEGPGTALVGHNPEVAEAIAISAGKPSAVPPGTVAALDLSGPEPRLLWLRSP
jgi:phosphohistidine phosphatase